MVVVDPHDSDWNPVLLINGRLQLGADQDSEFQYLQNTLGAPRCGPCAGRGPCASTCLTVVDSGLSLSTQGCICGSQPLMSKQGKYGLLSADVLAIFTLSLGCCDSQFNLQRLSRSILADVSRTLVGLNDR